MTTKGKRLAAANKAWWARLTPEERSREMKRRARLGKKKRHAAERRGGHPHSHGTNHAQQRGQDLSNHVAYCFGRTEAFLDFYASGAGVPRAALAAGVAELLRGAALR